MPRNRCFLALAAALTLTPAPLPKGEGSFRNRLWIHGDGNLMGGAGLPLYDVRHLAAAGVVLVSIQYIGV